MRCPIPARRQAGSAAVEFALVTSVLFMLLFGIMEMSRMLFYWNTATEATRLGARIASICAPDATGIKDSMTALFPVIAAADISISYLPSGCTASDCEQVTVYLHKTDALNIPIPFVPLTLTLPSFSTTVPRESMQSSIAGVTNPNCG
jgi:hypothetical protein